MEQANQDKNQRTNFYMKDKNPTHLFRRLALEKTQFSEHKRPPKPESLNLKLSLGGIYTGTTKEKSLSRSSSILGVITLKKDPSEEMPKNFVPVGRSRSLPTEAEQEQRLAYLIELMAARAGKRRILENQTTVNKKENAVQPPRGPTSLPFEIPAWAAASAAKSPAFCRAISKIREQGNSSGLEDISAAMGPGGYKLSPEAKNAETVVFPGASSVGKSVRPAGTNPGNPFKKAKVGNGGICDDGMAVMNQMPSVATTGDGPNGRRIEGFLYKYTKSQVSIVCVCHGSFLTPEEFVRHSGAKDVSNPMKRITVFPTSFSF